MSVRLKKVCLLCGAAPVVLGHWITDPPLAQRLGAAPGKSRIMLYCLCRSCARKPDARRRAENVMLRDTYLQKTRPGEN